MSDRIDLSEGETTPEPAPTASVSETELRDLDRELRQALIGISLEGAKAGLIAGTGGNSSARLAGDAILITPTETSYADMIQSDIACARPDGSITGEPSRDLGLHRLIYSRRRDVNAIVHVDSPAASAAASLRREIPPFHDSVSFVGGPTIRCSEYAAPRTREWAHAIVAALDGRQACLIANHGQIAVGSSVNAAMDLAIHVEGLCDRYLRARAAGTPVLLSDAEMDTVLTDYA